MVLYLVSLLYQRHVSEDVFHHKVVAPEGSQHESQPQKDS